MPVIDVECSRIVRYTKNVEVTDEQAAEFHKAFDSQDRKEVHQWLDAWIDPRYDVLDADEYDVLNASIDDQPLYL